MGTGVAEKRSGSGVGRGADAAPFAPADPLAAPAVVAAGEGATVAPGAAPEAAPGVAPFVGAAKGAARVAVGSGALALGAEVAAEEAVVEEAEPEEAALEALEPLIGAGEPLAAGVLLEPPVPPLPPGVAVGSGVRGSLRALALEASLVVLPTEFEAPSFGDEAGRNAKNNPAATKAVTTAPTTMAATLVFFPSKRAITCPWNGLLPTVHPSPDANEVPTPLFWANQATNRPASFSNLDRCAVTSP